ncbi:MAG: efflux RND transporter periplasmic adaptor subunit [Calditrichia bacterium]
MKFKAVFIPVAIIIASIIIMIALFSLRSDPPKAPAVPQTKIVDIEVAHLQDIESEIVGLGRLTSALPLVLFSEVSGTVMEGTVPFQPAQSFRKGDLVLKIDDRQIQLDIKSAKSEFLNALSSVLPEIKIDFPIDFEVWQSYFDQCDVYSPLPPLPETENQKIKLYLSRFNVYKLYFSVRNLEIRLEKHYFYAPFSGSIISADLRVGSIARNGSRLGEIINLDNLEVELPIPAEDIVWIDKTKPVILISEEMGKQWQGTIARIGNSIDPKTQSVSLFVRLNISNRGEIFEGIFLKARISGKIVKNAILIPRKILYQENYIYFIKNGRLDYRPVEISRLQTDSVIVSEGISQGDTIVTEVLQGVASGMLARPKSILSEERSQ